MNAYLGVFDTAGKNAVDHLIDHDEFTCYPKKGDRNGGNKNVSSRKKMSFIDFNSKTVHFSSPENDFWINFEGELYNFSELRHILIMKGHRFFTDSETELISRAYDQWGSRCFEMFRGAFALGIFDRKRNKLVVARDHFGIKPLYYYHDNEYFGFSSELSSFLQVPNLSLEPDPEAIDLYLTYRHIPAPKTIFKQIKKLPPAHFLTLNSHGCVTGPEMFWNPFENRIVMGQKDEWIEELDRMLRDSVQMYMDTADSWGAYITGDLGSLAIMGYISQLTGQPVQTFGIDFNEQNGSLDRILTTSEKNAINLEKIDPCLLDILPSLVKQFDEPYGKIDSIYHYHLSRLSSGVISTALSALSPESSVFGCCPFESLISNREAIWENHAIRLSDSMNQSTRRALWRDEYREVCNHSGQFIRDLVSSHLETVNWTLSNRVESGIVPVSLFYGSEKPGNHLNGVNIRMPFLDPRVAEFIIAGSEQIRIISQTNGKDPLKGVMKKIVEKYYPDGCPFAGKPKTDTIQKQWLGDGKALNRVAERLTGKDSSLYPYFRPEAVQELLWQSQSAEPAWLLLFLEEWMKNKKSV